MSSDGHKDDSDSPLIGHVVAERYFVEDRLGEGGMGTVYTARHVTLDKRVALKVLHGEFSRKPELVERFLQEAKAASSIRNEHVIDITDFGVTGEGFVFFAMEYLQGKDLHALLGEVVKEGELLPWERSKKIFLQICEALSAAHAQGIIHRDLKPENIFLVDGTGRADYVKLLDFGIAKVQSTGEEGERRLTKTGMLFGTPEYMAPEQARGEKPDHRVDVYAMGCLLFQLVAGTVPFRSDSFMAILTQHMVEPIPEVGVDLLARSGAPSGIVDVVYKALAKNREERYATMADLADAVREARADQPLAATAAKASAEGKSRSKSETSTPRWTGSVRSIDTLVEEEAEVEAEYSRQETEAGGQRKWPLAVAALALLGGGALAATLLMGGSGGSQEREGPARVDTPETQVLPAGGEAPKAAAETPPDLQGAAIAPVAPPEDIGADQAKAATESETPEGKAPEIEAAAKSPTQTNVRPEGERKPPRKGDAEARATRDKAASEPTLKSDERLGGEPDKKDEKATEKNAEKHSKTDESKDTTALEELKVKDPFK